MDSGGRDGGGRGGSGRGGRDGGRGGGSGRGGGGRGRGGGGRGGAREPRSKDSSVFTKSGVDMSISDSKSDGRGELSKIFPSMGRGRGRGRGAYMR